MAYSIIENRLGLLPIASFETGASLPLGTIVRAVDPTFGQGEFIYLAGVASTAVGSLVIYNTTSFTTTLCPVTSNLGQPVAVAMSANILATTFGWYQVEGVAVVAKSTGITFAANVALGVNSTGKVGASASGKQVLGARTANTATVASATTTVNVVIQRPHLMGRVT